MAFLLQKRMKKVHDDKKKISDRSKFVSEKMYEHHFGNEYYSRIDSSIPSSHVLHKKCLLTYPWPPFRMGQFQPVVVKDKDAWTKIFIDTVDQRDSSQWFAERSNRITASSRAHLIRNRKKMFPKLAEQFLNETSNAFATDAMDYGVALESTARERFELKTGFKVDMVGLVVKMSQPFLAASPDGIIVEDDMSLLEIKCPFKRQNALLIDSKLKVSYVSYLIYHDENNIQLQKTHKYYTQVQLQMYVCNASKCHFFVYSSKDEVHLTIPRDEKFLSDLIPKLERFYFTYFLPLISKK